MQSPPTPQHPAANEEVSDLPSGSMPAETIENLDLNPELYDEEDSTPMVPPNENENEKQDDSDVSFENINMIKLKSLTVSFDDQFDSLKSEFLERNYDLKVTRAQQSKLVNYIDEEYLKIQRKFIKNQADVGITYTLQELVGDISKIIELLWYSINSKSAMFGQSDYLIKITGDLEDFLAYYSLSDYFNYTSSPILNSENTSNLINFFRFIQKIDLIISFLIDGYNIEGTNRKEKLNSTQIIRLLPIISRLRILIVSKIEPIRLRLGIVIRNTSEESQTPNSALYNEGSDLLNKLEVEVSRIFEGILDRS